MSLLEKPPLDPYPLSPYVAWAGNRNRDAILEVFKQKFPQEGNVLELATGSGMHIHYFAPHFQSLNFQPSDFDQDVFENIQSLTQQTNAKNVEPPINLDLTQPSTWLSLNNKKFNVIFCINLFQVALISIADGVANCTAHHLNARGSLYIYGPFKVNGKNTTPSNEEFDKTLLSSGVPEWGLKDVTDINNAAYKYNIELKEKIDMPANNFILVYEFR